MKLQNCLHQPCIFDVVKDDVMNLTGWIMLLLILFYLVAPGHLDTLEDEGVR
jgi:hypothetical protein